MGKSVPSAARLQNFARIISSERFNTPKQAKPPTSNKVSPSSKIQQQSVGRVDTAQLGLKMDNSVSRNNNRVPLSHVVSDCVKRWFQGTLKEAKAGDSAMQLLVGQKYNSGYGVRKDAEKGRTWIARASKGYNASDSESEDVRS